MAVIPIYGRFHCAPIDCGGGGGAGPSRRLLKPNLAQILALRGFPMDDLILRPKEIRNIAIFDDEPAVAKAVARILQRISPTAARIEVPESGEMIYPKDKTVIFTASTKAQIDLLIKHSNETEIDLLFTDHDMIGINGSLVSKALRTDQKFNGFIIGLTGLMEKNREPFYNSGADLVLEKPFNTDSITNLFIRD